MSSRFDDVSIERLRQRRTVKWTLYGPDVLAAWVAEMDFDVAPPVRAALLDAIDREDFGYTEADTSELTNAFTAFLAATYDWAVSPARVFLVADVLAGLAGAFDEFVPAGCPVIVPTPAYPPLFEVVELGGRSVVPLPLTPNHDGRTSLDLDAIDASFRAGARALLLCNPQNPTGRAFSREELTELARIVDQHGARVIADEVHAPLVYPDARHVPYASVADAAAAHAVTVMSASKAWNLAGLKCAQVVMSNHDDAAHWRRLPVFKVPGPTPLGIAASTAAYADGGPWRRELVEYLDGNRQRLAQLIETELPGVAYRPPDGTFLAWLDCAALGVDAPADLFLRAGGVAVSDGPPFGAGSEQHVRLTFATSRALLERIVEGMGAATRSNRPR